MEVSSERNFSLDYRSLLKEELDTRVRRNPRYSLRSFARDLEMSGSQLSDILNGKQGLSLSRAKKIASILKWAEIKTEYFCDLVECQHARSQARRTSALLRLEKCHGRPQITQRLIEETRILSEPLHFSILELTRIQGFVSDINWIAARLGESTRACEEAIQRLVKTGMLKVDNGMMIDVSGDFTTSSDIPSEAARNFHKNILRKAVRAIDDQNIHERELQSFVVAVNPENLADAKERIRQFCADLSVALGSGTPKSVYALSVQLFRLTENVEVANEVVV